MNVKVSYGKVFNALDIKQKEDSNRITLLEKNMIEKDKEVSLLKGEIVNLKGTIKKLNEDNNSLSKNRDMLNEELKATTNQKETLKDNIVSSTKSTTDLIESNKKLQLEVEKLNMIIASKDKAENKINEEYAQMTKIKNNFEDKIIALSSKIDQLTAKTVSNEQMIKQKDKYIQMLVNNKKSNCMTNVNPNADRTDHASSNHLQQFTKPTYNKDTPDPNVMNNIILLKNKLTEKESAIYHLKEEIKALKKDNGNLLTRLKNSTPKSILMKKAI